VPDLTLPELAARVAVIEQRLGITPAPTPVPTPTPAPGPQVPAAPTGLRATTLADGRVQLDWDPAAGVQSWDVLDLLDTVTPVKDTVLKPQSLRSALKAGARRRYAVRARGAGGASPLSAPLDLPAAAPKPDPKPGTVNYPADIVGKNFYLTVPVKDPVDGWAMEIEQPTLATYDSKYFLLTDDHTGAVFRVWHGGATTSGSKNPRSELREQTLDGKAHAAWASKVGRHRMVVKIRVNRLTKVRPHVVIGQIHDAADDVSVFRVEGSNLWITAGDSPHGYLLDGSFALGRDYEIGFDVSGGVISYLYNGKVVPYTLTADFSGAYFKTGAYLQSNPTSAPGESTDEFAEVVIYSVAVTHS
jgi:hypothetical protein